MFFQLSRCYRVVERFIISSVHTMVQNQKKRYRKRYLFFGAEGETRPLKAKAFFGTHAGTVTVHRTVTILRIALFDSLFFASKKRYRKRYLFFGAEGETRTLAPVTRPTPLAGAPRHQLEYFCKLTG